MNYLLSAVAAIATSLVIIPIMVRLAPWFGMIDRPEARKIHVAPIPRVGGWGIVIGALLPLVIWAPFSEILTAYIFGAVVLLLFGALDDRRELGHYTKFIGQFLAIIPLVTYGHLYVETLPFIDIDFSPLVGQIFTTVAMVGMVNALNHSDGLDGLAGGEALLSLGGMALLAYVGEGKLAILITSATIGGLLGFLRYNTHPASVFMGDGGSQFLGYTLGFVAVFLTQRIDTDISATAVALLLGLPVVDILVVFKRRVTQGKNWFRATKDHIHHRLLDLGYTHQETVVIIYSVQTLCVVSGILLCYANAWVVLAVYLAICISLFVFINVTERTGWHRVQPQEPDRFGQAITFLRHRFLVILPRQYLDLAVPAYILGGSLMVNQVPLDFGIVSGCVFVFILLEAALTTTPRSLSRRLLIYIIIVCIAYLNFDYPWELGQWWSTIRLGMYSLTAVAVAVAIRFSPKRREYEFRTTAMDYLMIFVVLASLGFSHMQFGGNIVSVFVVKLVILLYASELIIIEKRQRWTMLTTAALLASGVLAVRGLL